MDTTDWHVSTLQAPPQRGQRKRKETAGREPQTKPIEKSNNSDLKALNETNFKRLSEHCSKYSDRAVAIAKLMGRVPGDEDEWQLYKIEFGLDSDENIASTLRRIGELEDVNLPGYPHGTYSKTVYRLDLTTAAKFFQLYLCALGSYIAKSLKAPVQLEFFEGCLPEGEINRQKWRTQAMHLFRDSDKRKSKDEGIFELGFYMRPSVWELNALRRSTGDLEFILDKYCGTTKQVVFYPPFLLKHWFPENSYKDICLSLGTECDEEKYAEFLGYCTKLKISDIFGNNTAFKYGLDFILTINLRISLKGYLSIKASDETQKCAVRASQKQHDPWPSKNKEAVTYLYDWSDTLHQPVAISALKDLVQEGILTSAEPSVFAKRAVGHLTGSTITPTMTIQIIVATSAIKSIVVLSGDGWKREEEWGIQAIFVLDENTVFFAEDVQYLSLTASKPEPPLAPSS